jgi:uncharacterized protein
MSDSNRPAVPVASSPEARPGGANPTAATSPAKRRGFATMDPARVRDLGRRGGKAAHLAGTAHEFSADEARAAGRKGGLAMHSNRPPNDKKSTP